MSYSVEISEQANADLRGIFEYITFELQSVHNATELPQRNSYHGLKRRSCLWIICRSVSTDTAGSLGQAVVCASCRWTITVCSISLILTKELSASALCSEDEIWTQSLQNTQQNSTEEKIE